MSGAPAAAAAASAAPASSGGLRVHRAPAAPSAASSSAGPGGAGPSPMDLSGEEALDAAAAVREKRTAAATAAAAAACVQLAAAATGPYGKMHSSDQVLLLDESELWDTVAENWCKPGGERIEAIVETWEGRDLAACVYKLGLPVIYAKKNYQQHMRRSVVDAVRRYARDHPELFDAAAPEQKEAEAPRRAPSPPKTPPRAATAAAQRRSPRSPASSRSVAAAIAAADDLPLVSSHRPKARHGAARSKLASPPEVRLHDAGAGESDSSDGDGSDSDSDWSPESDADSVSSAARRGGRLRDADVEHHLAQAGVERSFADGFLRNARFAAGGRSMYQLYKEVTSAFPHESSKRECLALSRILDALLRRDLAGALEHTCRRLGGVHTAAETGNWAMCERLETEAEQRSFVPAHFMRSALKSVVQMQAVKKSASGNSAGSGRGAARDAASGKGGKGKQRSASKPKDAAKSDMGASSSHKKGGSEKP